MHEQWIPGHLLGLGMKLYDCLIETSCLGARYAQMQGMPPGRQKHLDGSELLQLTSSDPFKYYSHFNTRLSIVMKAICKCPCLCYKKMQTSYLGFLGRFMWRRTVILGQLLRCFKLILKQPRFSIASNQIKTLPLTLKMMSSNTNAVRAVTNGLKLSVGDSLS